MSIMTDVFMEIVNMGAVTDDTLSGHECLQSRDADGFSFFASVMRVYGFGTRVSLTAIRVPEVLGRLRPIPFPAFLVGIDVGRSLRNGHFSPRCGQRLTAHLSSM
jgi:hypothetical protein